MATEKPKAAAPKPEIERLNPKTDGSSANILEENIERLKELFPEIVTELKVDFDASRRLSAITSRSGLSANALAGMGRAGRLKTNPWSRMTGSPSPCIK